MSVKPAKLLVFQFGDGDGEAIISGATIELCADFALCNSLFTWRAFAATRGTVRIFFNLGSMKSKMSM
jgi:hypothetical protein